MDAGGRATQEQLPDALERPLDRLFQTRFSTAVPDAVLPPPSLESYRIHPWMRTSCIRAVVLHQVCMQFAVVV